MTISSRKITAYTKTHQMLPPVPSPAYSATQLQQWYDTAPEEARVAINGIIDDMLSSALGNSGAQNIGVETISGVAGNNVLVVLQDLKSQINGAVAGTIPDGTITAQKLAFDPGVVAKDVSGTGTAITISMTSFPSYTDNRLITFIASANNSASATTININGLGAKSLYKPGTTTAPNLIVGKAYTVWYDAAANAFFIKASAEGTAVAGHVLAPFTFSNDSDVGLPGSMVSYAGTGHTVTPAVNGTTLQLFSPVSGYIDTTTLFMADDPDFISANFTGNIFGKQGTLVRGAPIASGTVTNDATLLSFTQDSGTAQNSTFMTVSGLALPAAPSFIYIRRLGGVGAGSDETIYDASGVSSWYGAGLGKILKMTHTSNSTSSGTIYRLDGTSAYVNTTGFRLPVMSNPFSYEWEIYA